MLLPDFPRAGLPSEIGHFPASAIPILASYMRLPVSNINGGSPR
jgi:hypothetical protein